MTVDIVAMPKKIRPVPVKAVMISPAPLARPSTAPIRRDSIRPMKNVKPSSTGTPAAEFFVFSIANIRPKAPPRNTIRLMPGPIAANDAGADADPRAEHGGHHRQREQPVGVAQDTVALRSDIAAAGVAGEDGLQTFVH